MKIVYKLFLKVLLLSTVVLSVSFSGRAFFASGQNSPGQAAPRYSFERVARDLFDEAAEDYEKSASSEIALIKTLASELFSIPGISSPAERVAKLSRLCVPPDAELGAGDGVAAPAHILDVLKAARDKDPDSQGRVRIVENRAVLYIYNEMAFGPGPAAESGRPREKFEPGMEYLKYTPPLYFRKNKDGWLLDSGYMFRLISGRTGHLYQDAETFMLAEQLWLLSQYKEFSGFDSLLEGDFTGSLNSHAAGSDVKNPAEPYLKGPALDFYMCLLEFKAGRYKQSYSHISACRALSGGNFIVETVFNMILSQRKFGRLIDEKYVQGYRKDPYNYLALMVIGEFYNLNFSFGLSVSAFRLASQLNCRLTPHYHVVYANTLENLKNYKAAGDELSKCSSYGPEFYYTRYLAGKKYILGGEDKKAAAEFESVISSLNFAETKREVAGWLMNYHLKNGNLPSYYEYRREYYKSFFNSPMFIGILIILWFVYMLRKTMARYLMIPFLKALARFYKNEKLCGKIFDAYCNFADGESGVKFYESYIKSISQQTQPQVFERSSLKLANYLLSIYRPEEAKKIFAGLLSFRPDCAGALLGLGIAEYDLKNIDIAIEYFMSGIETEHENHLFYYYAGICNMLKGFKKEAIELIMISYKINSSFEPALNLCNNYFLSNNMITELVTFYDDLFVLGDLNENYVQHYLKLNTCRMDASRILKMIGVYDKIKVARPETYMDMALANRELELFEEAAALICRSILLAGGYTRLSGLKSLPLLELAALNLPRYKNLQSFNHQLLELGITFRRMGRNAKAESVFKRILKRSPDYAYANYMLNDFSRSIELMAAELSESNYPWNNASIVEAIYHCLKETNNPQRLDRYREWGVHYARSISNDFGIFSYRYLKYIPKERFLKIISDMETEIKINS
ncbi:MAG TPA: tetratricopeptide repeat protein [Candidatus Wallbacteria bacterium]|nr:tetratricopeptide repeat protein [Candidatus Wallbacteria bacterium]